MSKLFWEKWHPYIWGLIALALWYLYEPTFPVDNNDVLAATLNVSAILMGFLATAKALLMTLDTPVMQKLQSAGYIKDIASYMREGIHLSFLLCVHSILGYFILKPRPDWYIYVWLFLSVAAGLGFLRVTSILLKLFEKKK